MNLGRGTIGQRRLKSRGNEHFMDNPHRFYCVDAALGRQGLIDQAQEFLPRGRTVTEAAQHPAGDKVRVRFVHPARGHAMMGCL